MSDEELDAIEARAAKASEGPWRMGTGWEQCTPGLYISDYGGSIVYAEGDHPPGDLNEPLVLDDATFIAAARTDIPRLCEEVKRLRRIEQAARAYMTAIAEGGHGNEKGEYRALRDALDGKEP